ncbi:MAG: GH3 auxin-responsive promoter family protein, partial [Gemmatimonadaceae bacterium]|nr:GH3 auxin-responsive promoter family protein [Acetobacteraceae bacterium]
AAQQDTLARLVHRARDTRFGRDHRFDGLRSVEAYQRRVRLRHYEDFWRDYWEPGFPVLRDATWPGRMSYYALTSGTTGGPSKYIPVSRAMARANTGAALDTMAFHLGARPGSRVFGGANLLLGGSTALTRLASGVRAGDLSGIAAHLMPVWARARAMPSRELSLLGDWRRKIEALAPASVAADIRSLSGTPSWLLLFLDAVAALHPDRPRRLQSFYPNLELVVHGGVGFAPYRDRMAAWLDGSHAETREVYAASEGFIASADRGDGEGMRLSLDRGLFFEFVPVDQLDRPDPERRWMATAEVGVEYALVLTTNAGLWSYVLGDTVTLVDLRPPRVLVTGRTSFTLNAFGEHLAAHELDLAVAEAARHVGADVVDYAAGAVFPDPASARGGHAFVVELRPFRASDAAAFERALDGSLTRQNADYADHRRDGFGILPPTVTLAAPDTFAAWMERRGRLGGQNKVPRVIQDRAMLDDLVRFVRNGG